MAFAILAGQPRIWLNSAVASSIGVPAAMDVGINPMEFVAIASSSCSLRSVRLISLRLTFLLPNRFGHDGRTRGVTPRWQRSVFALASSATRGGMSLHMTLPTLRRRARPFNLGMMRRRLPTYTCPPALDLALSPWMSVLPPKADPG